jgi:hypothetical protein
MFAFTLESLVLRGVLVLRGEPAVGLRLGSGTKANPQATTIRNSTRHPAPGWRLSTVPSVAKPDGDYSPSGEMPGAGRSRRQLGALMLPGAARTRGGSATTVASSLPGISAQLDAPVSEAIPSLAVRQSEKQSGEKRFPGEAFARLPVTPCWRKPAGRTPPVSMRENDGL